MLYEITIKSHLLQFNSANFENLHHYATVLGFVFKHDKYDYNIFYPSCLSKLFLTAWNSNAINFLLSSFYWPSVTFHSMINWTQEIFLLWLQLQHSYPTGLVVFGLHHMLLTFCQLLTLDVLKTFLSNFLITAPPYILNSPFSNSPSRRSWFSNL